MSIRKTISAIVVVLALVPASAVADSHGTNRPVSGWSKGIVTVDVRTIEITASGAGHMTHFGKTATALDFVADTFSITADNGDAVFGTFTMTGTPSMTEVHTSYMVLEITGGTGRFSDATGTILATNTVTPFQFPTPGSPFLLETVEAVVSGYISY